MREQTAARITIGFAVVFVLVLAALHFLEPEYNAEGHLISEYELGPYGWFMSLAFFSLAGASLAICIAIKGDLQELGGSIGKWWLLLIATAYLGAGLFYPDDSTGGLGLPLDPAEWKRGTVAPTLNASLHGLAGVIVIATSPIVFSLLQRSLAKSPEWAGHIHTMRRATVAAWPSQWAAIASIASKLGCTAETLRRWVRQAERDTGHRSGLTTDERQRLKELEREVRELKRANEILRKASAYFAQAELDRRAK